MASNMTPISTNRYWSVTILSILATPFSLGIDAVLPTFQCPNCGKLLVCQSTDIEEPKTAKKRFLAIF